MRFPKNKKVEKGSFPILCPSEECQHQIEIPSLLQDFPEGTIINYYKFNFRNYLIEGKILPVISFVKLKKSPSYIEFQMLNRSMYGSFFKSFPL